jgi:LmbE family N-acetylglucosaminyl deacetylase
MEKLGVVGSVLYIGAHPDDENTRLISWLSNGKKVRTAYLSLTRGDGGQNLIGPELGDALGVLRTQELLEARRIDGGEQFFTRAVDFGYSKSAEETFAKWGKQEVLGDVVRVIRTFRPDVIITRFATDGSGGHGHHTASAILANEAFALAADPKAFPEQLAPGWKGGLEVWQAKRLFFNASTWWNANLADEAKKDPARWVSVDVGGFDPLLGASYTEIAGRSRSQHKSQGFGAAETRGEQIEYLRLDQGAVLAAHDLFDGIELSWARFPGAEGADRLLRDAVASFDPSAPEKSVRDLYGLAQGLGQLSEPGKPGGDWAKFQSNAARELILQALGAVVEVTSKLPSVATGDSTKVTLSVLQRRPGPPTISEFNCFELQAASPNETIEPNRPWTSEAVYSAGAFDQPYWLGMPHEALYHPGGGRSGIEPMSRSAAVFTCRLELLDARLAALPGKPSIFFERQLMQTWVDRVAGERTRAVAVTPIASIEIPDPVAIVRGEHALVSAELLALRDDVDGVLYARAPEGWSIESTGVAVKDVRRGERRALQVHLRRMKEALAGPLHLSFEGSRGSTDRTMHVIDYPHILPQTWYTPADVQLVPLDVAVSVKTVGYVDGAGDDVAKALKRLGVAVERIDPATANASDLEKCDAIVTGIRAYNTVKALALFQPVLLAYVENGGTLLVQYNTSGGDLVIDPKRSGRTRS